MVESTFEIPVVSELTRTTVWAQEGLGFRECSHCSEETYCEEFGSRVRGASKSTSSGSLFHVPSFSKSLSGVSILLIQQLIVGLLGS